MTMNIKLILPDGFLNEEVRNGFRVSEEMKRVWAVELDLLNEFDRICKEYEIPYYASGGTILGAIRHGGYIPWDDDIDIMIHRKDYDRLCRIGPTVFSQPYFFQEQKTEKNYRRGHVQIRNSDTTGILKRELQLKLKYNQGIFIDIFPLDNVPDDQEEYKDFLLEARRLQGQAEKMAYYSFCHQNDFHVLKPCVKSIISTACHKWFSRQEENRIFDRYFKFITQLKDRITEKCGLLCLSDERFIFYNDDISYPLYKPFEMLSIPIPNGYERILEGQYGDWKTPVIEPSVHGGVFFDTEKSYIEYIR